MILKFQSSIHPGHFQKVGKWWDFFEILKFSGKWEREGLLPFEFPERKLGWRFTARCHNTKTVAKRASWGGCTTVLLTMKKLFWKIIALWKCLWITIIVVEHILKFIERVLKFENDFKISELYRSRTFQKSWKMRWFLKFSNFLENETGRTPALRVPRAVTRLTVHCSLP